MTKICKRDMINDKFYSQSLGLFEENIKAFTKKSADMVLESSGWSSSVSQHQIELSEQLKSIIKAQREREIEKMQIIITKATHESIEEIVNSPIYELKATFWQEIRDPYTHELSMVLQNCSQILKNGFKAEELEEIDFLERFEIEIRTFTGDYIRKCFKDINQNLLRRFNSEFKNDRNGAQRNWVSMEEKDIREHWARSKAEIESLFKFFKYIEIPIDIAHKFSETPTPGMDPQEEEETKDADEQIPKYHRSGTTIYGKLLSETDLNKVKDRFNEDAHKELEDALRKHHNLGTGATPLWLYVILVYFAYDDIFRMLANPLLFYPLIFVFSIVAMLYSMGLGPVMIPVAKTSLNMGLRQVGIPF